MKFILEYWYIIVACICFVCAGAMIGVNFLKKPRAEQLQKVKEWLLYAVTMAEKELGGGTGKLKLRYVYSMFIDKFDWLVEIVSFEAFSKLVDEALGEMHRLLNSNGSVQTIVNGDKEIKEQE